MTAITNFDAEDCSFFIARRNSWQSVFVESCFGAEAPYITIQTFNKYRNRLLCSRSYHVLFGCVEDDGSASVTLVPAHYGIAGIGRLEKLCQRAKRGYGDWRSSRDLIDGLILAGVVKADNVAGMNPGIDTEIATLDLDVRGTTFMRGAACAHCGEPRSEKKKAHV